MEAASHDRSDTMDETRPQAAVPPADQDGADADQALLEFLDELESFKPLIPDAVMDYYMATAGVQCEDVRIKRLFGLVAQKFVADVASDAFQYARVRQQGSSGRDKRGGNNASSEKKMTLTLDDLAPALAEYGVNVKRPDFYR